MNNRKPGEQLEILHDVHERTHQLYVELRSILRQHKESNSDLKRWIVHCSVIECISRQVTCFEKQAAFVAGYFRTENGEDGDHQQPIQNAPFEVPLDPKGPLTAAYSAGGNGTMTEKLSARLFAAAQEWVQATRTFELVSKYPHPVEDVGPAEQKRDAAADCFRELLKQVDKLEEFNEDARKGREPTGR